MTNHGLSFADLRTANVERCTMWHPGGLGDWSLSDWATAVGGELGEAMNIIKKMNRNRDGIDGNEMTADELHEALAEEIADTMIYLDLLAARAGIPLALAVTRKFNHTSAKMGLPIYLTPSP